MKRSEMLNILTNKLILTGQDGFSAEFLADDALSILETNGMLPPRRPIQKDGVLISFVHSWEPEEKEKTYDK